MDRLIVGFVLFVVLTGSASLGIFGAYSNVYTNVSNDRYIHIKEDANFLHAWGMHVSAVVECEGVLHEDYSCEE